MADDTKAGSAMGLIVPVLLLTLAAAGGGFVVARQVIAQAKAAAAGEPPAPAPAEKHEATPDKPAATVVPTDIRELAPVLTNLAAPEGAVVRLQAAIVYDRTFAPQADLLAAKIGDDTLAYLKSLTVAQLEGAEGLQHLREDLGERAALRSDGRVREVLIEALVVQ